MTLQNYQEIEEFQKLVYRNAVAAGRTFPWRNTDDPYKILLSECMLQQTQAERVVPKYEAFVERFGKVEGLAAARLSEVLKLWQGLGYNRRGQALHSTAKLITEKFQAIIPSSFTDLCSLPGIGPYTASAIRAFAFNQADLIIETNIRAVYLHHFFPNQAKIDDQLLKPLIKRSIDHKQIRHWYQSLMDYGWSLKKTHKNPSRRSKHHQVQSPFPGSNRQIRGAILRVLSKQSQLSSQKLHQAIESDLTQEIKIEIFEQICNQLRQENLISLTPDLFFQLSD